MLGLLVCCGLVVIVVSGCRFVILHACLRVCTWLWLACRWGFGWFCFGFDFSMVLLGILFLVVYCLVCFVSFTLCVAGKVYDF